MKIMSWNVNGLRAILNKGFLDVLKEEHPDMLGIQETKLQADQLPDSVQSPEGYRTIWNFAERKGYSGTGIFYRINPLEIKIRNFGSEILEKEGRVIEMEYPEFHLFNIYFPNGQMSDVRLRYKLDFYDQSLAYFNRLKDQGKNLIIMGDFNSDWQAEASAVRRLAEGLDLQAYEPEGKDLATFRSRNTRLDWVLISEEMKFISYRVLPERVSDHSAILAEIGLVGDS